MASLAEHVPMPRHGLQLYQTKSSHQVKGTLNSRGALLGALNFVARLCFQHKHCAAMWMFGIEVYPVLSYLLLFGKPTGTSPSLFTGKMMCADFK